MVKNNESDVFGYSVSQMKVKGDIILAETNFVLYLNVSFVNCRFVSR